jgi:hypothetical protein
VIRNIALISLFIISLLAFSACSAVQEVSNGVDYAKAATNYINKVLTFKSDVTQFLEQGKFDGENRKAFLPKVEQMKKDVTAFEALTPPDVEAIKSIHQQISDFNQTFKPSLETMSTALSAETPNLSLDQVQAKMAEEFNAVKNLQGQLDPLKSLVK